MHKKYFSLFLLCLFLTIPEISCAADCEKGTARDQYQEAVAKEILSGGAVISEEAARVGRSESKKYAEDIFNKCTQRIMNTINKGWKQIKSLSELFKTDVFEGIIEEALDKVIEESCYTLQADTISIMNGVLNRSVGNVQGIIYTTRSRLTNPSYLSNQLNIRNRLSIQNLFQNSVLP